MRDLSGVNAIRANKQAITAIIMDTMVINRLERVNFINHNCLCVISFTKDTLKRSFLDSLLFFAIHL